MKIKDITLNNFGKYAQVSASFDDRVTYLVGPNGAGKSTLGFTGVQFMFEGIAEKATNGKSPLIGERFRFIGPDGKSSKGEMTLYDEQTGVEVKVIRNMTKDVNTVRFEGPAGMKLDQPWLTELFNEFMIAPKKFVQLSAFDQARALGIDTTTFDSNIKALKDQYTGINREIKAMGTLVEVEFCKEVDLTDLSAQKEAERMRLNELYKKNKQDNKEAKEKYESDLQLWNAKLAAHNKSIEDGKDCVQSAYDSFEKLFTSLGIDPNESVEGSLQEAILILINEFEGKIKKPLTAEQLEKYTPKVPEYVEEMPKDDTIQAIDKQILEASQTNKKATEYTAYLKKKKDLDDLTKQLTDNKAQQDAEVEKRLNYIKTLPFPFENLAVDEEGGLTFDSKPIKEPYFSTGELIKMVPILLSSLGQKLKFVFLQDFNLLDLNKQQDVEKYLTDAGYQLVIEYVGTEELTDKNCILLQERVITN
jgi:hypothetical protein